MDGWSWPVFSGSRHTAAVYYTIRCDHRWVVLAVSHPNHVLLYTSCAVCYKCCSIQALPLIHQLPPIIPVLPVDPNLTPDLPRLITTLEDTPDHTIATTPRPMPTSIVMDRLPSIPTKLLEKNSTLGIH